MSCPVPRGLCLETRVILFWLRARSEFQSFRMVRGTNAEADRTAKTILVFMIFNVFINLLVFWS